VQVFYSFPGLENIDDDTVYILQPVIQYGYNSYFGGSYWTAASWRCDGDSGTCMHGTPIPIGDSDSVLGTIDASACVNGRCTWTTVVVDVTRDTRSNWTATDTVNYNWTTGGAVEVRGGGGLGLTQCNQFPDTGVFYAGISLYDANWTRLTPAWDTVVQPNVSPSCGFDVATTSTTVNVTYNPPPPPPSLSASISGPSQVRQNCEYTWSASVSGGQSPYSYQWSGELSGTGPSVTGALSTSGTLYLDVSSADGQHASNSLYITMTGLPCPQAPTP